MILILAKGSNFAPRAQITWLELCRSKMPVDCRRMCRSLDHLYTNIIRNLIETYVQLMLTL